RPRYRLQAVDRCGRRLGFARVPAEASRKIGLEHIGSVRFEKGTVLLRVTRCGPFQHGHWAPARIADQPLPRPEGFHLEAALRQFYVRTRRNRIHACTRRAFHKEQVAGFVLADDLYGVESERSSASTKPATCSR